MSDRIIFKCLKCESTDFEIPRNPKAEDMITCVGCGASGKYADVQNEAIKQAKKVVEDMAKKAFKRFK